jgi:hypothetical protein
MCRPWVRATIRKLVKPQGHESRPGAFAYLKDDEYGRLVSRFTPR